MAEEGIVVVGGGLAGATAAKTLRAEGFSGSITVLAEESHPPYLRPPLSKDYLLGTAGEDTLPVVPVHWYTENDVDHRLGGAVTGLDPAAHAVTLIDGSRLGYSRLLLANGARPRCLPLPGSGLDGVTTFRTVDGSRRLRGVLAGGGKTVVLIGSGWIGLELAAAATAMLGQDAVLDTIPYVYTDQFEVSMEYSGFPSLVAGPPAVRGSLEAKEFIAFWQREGRVVAGMSVNWPRAAKPQKAIKSLIAARATVSPLALADTSVPLDQLLAEA